jgi:hypothetical protein
MSDQTARTASVKSRMAQATANSERFPITARRVAELRRYFPGVKLRYAKEGHYEIGKRLE